MPGARGARPIVAPRRIRNIACVAQPVTPRFVAGISGRGSAICIGVAQAMDS
jgi:hypothetical protein